jgi:hypothetical protein
MLTADKSFGSFDHPQKSLRLVSVYSVLDIFLMRNQLKIFNSVIAAVKVLVVYLHSVRNWAYKSLPHSTMYANFPVLAIFARRKDSVTVYEMRLDWPSVAVTSPRLTMFDVERGGNAGFEKSSNCAQRGAIRKHGFGGVNLLGGEQLSPRHTPYTRKIADFVKALVAANWFPNLHTVDIKPVYVGGQ